MELKNNDIIKLNDDMFIVVEKMATESDENYILLHSLTKAGEVAICKEEKDSDVLAQIQNDYLLKKLSQAFWEKIKERLKTEHNIKVVKDGEEE